MGAFALQMNVELIGTMGWVGVGAVGASWLLLLLAALRYVCVLSRWDTHRAESTEFCEHRRWHTSPECEDRRDRIVHMVRTEMVLPAVFCGGTWKQDHPHDALQRLSVLACAATVALAVALYWIRAAGVAAEELGGGDFLKLGLFIVGVLSPPIWMVETAFLWLRRPVLDVIELGLIGAEERANWNRLRCMPRRVVPYRVAERYLAGKQIKPVSGEGEALRRVEAPYFDRARDEAAIPRLLGAQASKMRRHEPWLWHMGAAWLCWSQLEDDEGREAGHGGARWVMEHMASHGRLASDESFGPDGLRAQGGAAADLLVGLSGRSAEGEADYRLWHALSLGGEILAQLDGWHATHGQLRKVAKQARKQIKKQHRNEGGDGAATATEQNGADPMKVAANAAAKLTVSILGLERPSVTLAHGDSSADAAGRFVQAAMRVCLECERECAAWDGADDTRFIAALHRAARGMWVMVRDRLHQHLRAEAVDQAPFSPALMPQYLRQQQQQQQQQPAQEDIDQMVLKTDKPSTASAANTLSPFPCIENDGLPRQARDKHKENSNEKWWFPQRSVSQSPSQRFCGTAATLSRSHRHLQSPLPTVAYDPGKRSSFLSLKQSSSRAVRRLGLAFISMRMESSTAWRRPKTAHRSRRGLA
jgi:hypothetical protein